MPNATDDITLPAHWSQDFWKSPTPVQQQTSVGVVTCGLNPFFAIGNNLFSSFQYILSCSCLESLSLYNILLRENKG
jgi:hypothetical protein